VSFSEDELRQAGDEGVARTREHLQAERTLAEAAREHPEIAEKEMLMFAIREPNVSSG
jgi:hypothetical protein